MGEFFRDTPAKDTVLSPKYAEAADERRRPDDATSRPE